MFNKVILIGRLGQNAEAKTAQNNNGIELICTGGHGLLHVPEMLTSWFATQRWLCLDSSWSGVLFGRI